MGKTRRLLAPVLCGAASTAAPAAPSAQATMDGPEDREPRWSLTTTGTDA
ncbi:hypothetical protein ACWD04_25505 [Streptomyces sp. NPDC002911]